MRDNWDEALNRFAAQKLTVVPRKIFVGVVESAKVHIQEGSPITGAPGQPVQSGELKRKWFVRYDGNKAFIYNPLIYAPFIETGISWHGTRMKVRSAVGGFRSIAKIRLNFQRLIDWVVVNVK